MSENLDPLDEALNRILPELRFEGVALADVIQFLRDVAAVNIHVNWRMLEVCGIDSNAKVTVCLVGATLGKVLETVLYDVDGGVIRLGYRAYDGLITISTQEDLARQVITKVYDVHDLVVDRNDADNPPARRQELETARLNGMANTLTQAVAPETWNFNGGHGSIGAMDYKLVIGQTPENHRAIKHLLEQLRAIPAGPTTGAQRIELAPTPPAGSQEQAGVASPEEGSGKPNLNEVVEAIESPDSTAPPVPPEKPKAQADKPNDPHAGDPFPPGEFVEAQSRRRYDFGGNLVLWELWKVLWSARVKLTADQLYSRVPSWKDQIVDQGNVHRALNRLRVFWRKHERDDFAKAIRSEGGFICPVNLRADA